MYGSGHIVFSLTDVSGDGGESSLLMSSTYYDGVTGQKVFEAPPYHIAPVRLNQKQ